MATPPSTSEWTERTVAAGFVGDVAPVRTGFGYKLASLLVAIAMIALPLIYVAIMGLVAWGVFHHATQNVPEVEGGTLRLAALVYAAPIAAGLILLVFMAKPLFAPPAQDEEPWPLERRRAPLLFAFIERISDAVGAPRPTRVLVDSSVNASASFHRGFAGLFSNELVLTIGAPLLVGMNQRQLGGVIAHELGHFGQGAGMRLSFVIRRISRWFVRLVHGRDAFDEKLVEASQSDVGYVAVFAGLGRACVWVARRVLSVLLFVGHALSTALLRQMEFDADRYEARVAGSTQYADTALRLTELTAATEVAHGRLEASWREGRLVDDVPGFVATLADRFDDETRRSLRQAMLSRKTGLLDTHPCDAERIASARRESTAGILRLDAPAALLVEDVHGLCRDVTREYYDEMLGLDAGRAQLVPLADWVGVQDKLEENLGAFERWAGGTLSQWRLPWPGADAFALTSSPHEALATLRAAHAEARAALPAGAAATRELGAAWTERLRADVAEATVAMGLEAVARENDLPVSAPELDAVRGRAERQAAAAGDALDAAHGALRRRSGAALSLLQHPKVQARIEDAPAKVERMQELVTVLAALEAGHPAAVEIWRTAMLLNSVLRAASSAPEPESHRQRLSLHAHHVVEAMRDARGALAGPPLPFEHAEGDVSLASHVVPELPDARDYGGVQAAARETVERFHSVASRALGEVAACVEEVERACVVTGAPPQRAAAPRAARSAGPSPS